MKANELSQIVAEVRAEPEVTLYQELTRADLRRSWFRKAILEPIIRPLIEKLLREYLEIAVRAAIRILISKGKL